MVGLGKAGWGLALMSVTKASEPIGRSLGGRKLIAVLHADMVGYSRLIGLDDVGTLERLRTLRKNLIDPAIDEHGGRIVNTGGDSLLIVFDSVDGAVRCAVKVQQQVPALDGDQPPDRAIRFRVGINVGDVIPDGTRCPRRGRECGGQTSGRVSAGRYLRLASGARPCARPARSWISSELGCSS